MTSLALYEDLLGPGETRSLPPGIRVLYVASGEASSLRPNEAWSGTDEIELRAGGEGATVLRWELTDWEPGDAKLAAHVDLDPWAEHVMRCERIVAGAGETVALGPRQGISCLLRGELRIGGEAAGHFEAWAEPSGAAQAEADGTAFVRVSLAVAGDVLPAGDVLAQERVRL